MIPKTTRLSGPESYQDTGRHFPGAHYPEVTCISIAMGPFIEGAPTLYADTNTSCVKVVFPELPCDDVRIRVFNSKGELIQQQLHARELEISNIDIAGQPCGEYRISLRWGSNYIKKEMVLAA